VNGVSALKLIYTPTFGVGYYKVNYSVSVSLLVSRVGAAFVVSIIKKSEISCVEAGNKDTTINGNVTKLQP